MVNLIKPEGFLNLLKPRGMTSHAAVAEVRRLFRCRDVGHLGTLDPDAEGVLPCALGRYTKLIPWVDLTPKIYRGWIHLGVGTTSGDAQGEAISRSGPPWPSGRELTQAARWLVGPRIQIPPRVSAIQQGGKRLYATVRKGQAVWPSPRSVQIHRIDIIQGSGQEWQFEASVGTGTYVRSMVRDWGFLTGHSAHLEGLERTRVGRFYEEDAWTLEALRGLPVIMTALQPFAEILAIPQVEIDPGMQQAVRHGQHAILNRLPGLNAPVVALTLDGDIMALVDGFRMRYIKVLIKDDPYATH